MNEIQGLTALVTGASRGIGSAAAIALAKAGAATVAIQYNSYPEGAEQTAAAVREAGARAVLLQGDLATEPGMHAFLALLADSGVKADILINNAGSLVQRSSVTEFPEDLYDKVMTLNVKSLWFITKAVAPHMIAQRRGVIVNVGSIAARNGGGPGATIYAAAKAAVAAITKGLAKELAPQGVRVNAISPGTVDNHFHEVFSTREILDNVTRMTPAGRLGTNEDMSDVILYLCSDAAGYIHGQTIEINGGIYMV